MQTETTVNTKTELHAAKIRKTDFVQLRKSLLQVLTLSGGPDGCQDVTAVTQCYGDCRLSNCSTPGVDQNSLTGPYPTADNHGVERR